MNLNEVKDAYNLEILNQEIIEEKITMLSDEIKKLKPSGTTNTKYRRTAIVGRYEIVNSELRAYKSQLLQSQKDCRSLDAMRYDILLRAFNTMSNASDEQA
jgi:uncharacterized small protein (DUF1192 family)